MNGLDSNLKELVFELIYRLPNLLKGNVSVPLIQVDS